MRLTRRAALLGAAALAMTPRAEADTWRLPEAAASSPAFGRWNRTPRLRVLPLDAPIVSETGAPTTLRRWIEGSPTVLTVWATWCAPCLVESADLAALSERLERAGAHAQVRALQAYDDAPYHAARRTLDRLNADALISGRATRAAEQALVRVFGAAQSSPSRIALPAMLIISPDGAELGRHNGLIEDSRGGYRYWREESTFEWLMSFGRA